MFLDSSFFERDAVPVINHLDRNLEVYSYMGVRVFG